MKASTIFSYIILPILSFYTLQAVRLTNSTPEIMMVNIKNARSQKIIATGCVSKARYLEITLPEPIPLIVDIEICNPLGQKIILEKKSSSLFNVQNSDELFFSNKIINESNVLRLIHIKKQTT